MRCVSKSPPHAEHPPCHPLGVRGSRRRPRPLTSGPEPGEGLHIQTSRAGLDAGRSWRRTLITQGADGNNGQPEGASNTSTGYGGGSCALGRLKTQGPSRATATHPVRGLALDGVPNLDSLSGEGGC
jgi:hypothetical protein